MNELRIEGTQEFMGMDIPVVYGGFGPDQKVILAKTIAEIHEVETKYINKLINENRNEFDDGIDILDLKNKGSYQEPLRLLGFTPRQISNYNNIYLLSEQGYMALVQLMRTEKAKEARKELRREYFAMRQVIESNENMKAQLLLAMYNGGAGAITAAQQLSKMEVEEAVAPLVETIEEQAPKVEYMEKVLANESLITTTDIAKDLGLKSAQVLNQILSDNKLLYNQSASNITTRLILAHIRDFFIHY